MNQLDHRLRTPFGPIEAKIRQVHALVGCDGSTLSTLYRLQVHLAKSLSEVVNDVLRPYGLNEVRFVVLTMLFTAPDHALNPSLVSDSTGESRANITRVADGMVAQGLIGRQPSLDDRRRHALCLTDAGKQLVAQVLPLIRNRLGLAFGTLGDSQCDHMIDLQKQLLAALEAQRGTHSAPQR